jgi:2-polyprenyl-6-methoxyphenol hydroxylase-like FAD-dependent oxidoreductase
MNNESRGGTMKSDAPEIDVLVVGAGPTGLVLAAELRARGVRARIIDKTPVRSDKSRALVVHARSLELFQKMGIADELRARGKDAIEANIFIERKQAATLQLGDIGVSDTPFPFLLFVSQAETEQLLDAHLARLGAEVERPVTLLGFDEDPGGITARLGHEGGREEAVRARFIAGCDGAHSAVRKAAGIPFEGSPYPQDFILADVAVDWERGHDQFFIFLAGKVLLAMFPMAGERVYRLIASRGEDAAKDAGDPTLAEFEAVARAVCPFPVRLHDPVWLARFHLHHRGARSYRRGRAFIAGDAAHIHSPAGGQGMNTGIQDAYNLAWKLSLVLEGRAAPSFLDSYNEERHPIGQVLLKTTDRMFAFTTAQNPLWIRLRNLLIPRVAPWMFNARARRARAFRFLSQLAIHYRGSSIVAEAEGRADAAWKRGPRPGERAGDAPLLLANDGRATSLFERHRGPGHALFIFGGRGAVAAAPAALSAEAKAAIDGYEGLVTPHVILGRAPAAALAPAPELLLPNVYIDESGLAHDRYGLEGPGVYLLRPDGYVAFRAPGLQGAQVAAYLRRFFTPDRLMASRR